MNLFVDKKSIVRQIWGKSDTVLVIFAGAAAEFALNKAVDWLYFTGKLPADPLGRLFSTVSYAKQIVFATREKAHHSIDMLQKIHGSVERDRGFSIPDWAYRDVLFMLIHYSIAAYELLENKLTSGEREEVYNVFYRVGTRMGLTKLPSNYLAWLPVRNEHLQQHLQRSELTVHLFEQYKKHIGTVRFQVLVAVQALIVPRQVKELLSFRQSTVVAPLVPLYKLTRWMKLDGLVKKILLPSAYIKQVQQLDLHTA